MQNDKKKLQRPIQPMTDAVRAQLESRQLMADYRARPAYQQNDYLAWIARAQRPETRAKRTAQMLDELHAGGVYMGMPHRPSRKA